MRLANKSDLEQLLTIYENARNFMRKTGNPNQWGKSNPTKEMVEKDIERQKLFVYENDDKIQGVFMFAIEEDPTYTYIEGEWMCDTPYGVLHRVASLGEERGVFDKIIDYCDSQIHHLRIDTHEDNKVMQNAILRNGFKYCGVIYMENGEPRIAYEKVEEMHD